MGSERIDAQMLERMFLSGAMNLEINKEWINELNVFPVPDGDTGTNMTLTIQSAVKEINQVPDHTMKTIAKAISSGSLRGARGNSGVILSQLFRGFTKVIKEEKELDIPMLASAVEKACATAYKAVMKPKEGTILTVAKGVSDKAMELAALEDELSMEDFLIQVVEAGRETLAKTPEMLPVLKEAGVVDSGGQGLMCILEGVLLAYQGKEITVPEASEGAAAADEAKEEELKFIYCTEFIVLADKPFTEDDEMDVKTFLSSMGEAVVCVADEDVVKMHVHTNEPGIVLQKAMKYGSLININIDNLKEEQEKRQDEAKRLSDMQQEARTKAEAKAAAVENKPFGFISVSIGEGIGSIFTELGVDYLIQGGQTMNPSTEDMLNAISHVHADTIFILPNNKNIVMAANQARDLTEDKQIIVLPTKTIPQGISALIAFVPELSAQENEEAMKEVISLVKTVQVTYAVRDTSIDGKEIHINDIMAVGDDGILAVGQEIQPVALEAIGEMLDDDAELISIYYGADYDEQRAGELAAALEEAYPDMDIEVNPGGQPVYYLMISVE